jgi:hypothetical protein
MLRLPFVPGWPGSASRPRPAILENYGNDSGGVLERNRDPEENETLEKENETSIRVRASRLGLERI